MCRARVPWEATFCFVFSFYASSGAVLKTPRLQAEVEREATVELPSTLSRVSWDEAFDVRVTRAVEYARGTVCNETYGSCQETKLLLDVYDPLMNSDVWRPAMIVVHGGAESVGSRDADGPVVATAQYYSRRGFVVFAIDYRLREDHGLWPCEDGVCDCGNSGGWFANPCLTYPAVRDYKAAVRFVRANRQEYNVDDSRIVATGGSAGATNVLVAALADEDLYKTELDLQDPTLNSTHLSVTSEISMAVLHWPFAAAFDEAILAYGAERFCRGPLPTFLHFHGSLDTTADLVRARSLKGEVDRLGGSYDLVVMEACTHMAWCGSPFRDGRTCENYTAALPEPVHECRCNVGCPMQDMYALPKIIEELSLELV